MTRDAFTMEEILELNLEAEKGMSGHGRDEELRLGNEGAERQGQGRAGVWRGASGGFSVEGGQQNGMN